MKIVVIIENKKNDNLIGEHGLCLYIEYKRKKYLLDGGPSNNIIANSKNLNIDLSKIDIGVLSHAHFDHATGYDGFFRENKTALIYLQEASKDPCYAKMGPIKIPVGIPKKILELHKERFKFVNFEFNLDEGVWLIPHYNKIPEKISKKQHLYRYENNQLKIDNLLHEQSLIFETNKGLVLFNSCMHAGVEYIINEVKHRFPNKNIHAVIGGFHLMGIGGIHTKRMSKKEIINIGENLLKTNIPYFYTGHCTGLPAYKILKEVMGDKLQYMSTGVTIEI